MSPWARSPFPRTMWDSLSHSRASSSLNRHPVSRMLRRPRLRNTTASECLPLAAMLLPSAIAVGASPR